MLSVLAVLMAIAIYIQGVDPNADNKQGHTQGGYEGGDDMYMRIKSEWIFNYDYHVQDLWRIYI